MDIQNNKRWNQDHQVLQDVHIKEQNNLSKDKWNLESDKSKIEEK